MSFWLIRDGEKEGPLSLSEITRRIDDGELSAQDPAWREGLPAWTRLGEIEELREVFAEKNDLLGIGGADSENHAAEDWRPAKPEPPAEGGKQPVWRRFWARCFDLHCYGALWWLAMSAAGQDIKSLLLSGWLPLIRLLPWFLIEAALIHRFATTPGKALLSLRVVNRDGSRLPLGASLSRAARVMLLGIGLEWGFLYPICMALSLFSVRRTGATLWDLSGGHRVEAGHVPGWRIGAYVIIFLTALQIESSVMSPAIMDMLGDRLPWLRKLYEESQPAGARKPAVIPNGSTG